MEVLNLSNNEITLIPALTSLESLRDLDVSGNVLDFGSLEENIGISNFSYGNQGLLGLSRSDTLPRGEDYFVNVQTSGSELSYQWYQDNVALSGSIEDNLSRRDVGISDIGSYKVEVQSGLVPDLTLTSREKDLTVVADIEYFPGFSFADGVRGILEEGQGILLKIQEGPYDTIAVVEIRNQAVLFQDIVLGDYLLKVDTDDAYRQYKEYNFSADSVGIDTVAFIPTHYISELEWDSAQVLELRDYISDTLEMIRIPPPLLPGDGNDGIIQMTVESDLPDEEGNRLEARRRVRKAGCSCRRNRSRGGGRTNEDDEWELIAYKETDDEGNVDFGFLPNGLYRINIQYPGVPMDPNSFIEFEISEEEEEDGYVLAATVFEDGIQVEVVEELGFVREYFKDLNVYPNPANDEIRITYAKLNSTDVSYQLMDLSGQMMVEGEVEKGQSQETRLETSGVQDGLYLLRFYDRKQNGKHLITYKVIIRH
jgi:hypothetical protein